MYNSFFTKKNMAKLLKKVDCLVAQVRCINKQLAGGTGYTSVNFDTDFGLKTTDDLTEGAINLYNATHTGDATGDTILTLATVNANVGTFGDTVTIPQIIVNGKGLITGVTDQAIPTADTVTTGLLSSADWNTFNNKISSAVVSLNTLTDTAQTLATDALNNSPTWTSAAGVHTLSLPLADSAVTSGLISNAAQTIYGVKTFNNGAETPEYFQVTGADWKNTGYKDRLGNYLIRGDGDGGTNNIVIGNDKNYLLLTGTSNFLAGRDSGLALTSGSYNTVIGNILTFNAATTATFNFVVGGGAARFLTTSNHNIIFGDNTGRFITSGSDDNIMMGRTVANVATNAQNNVLIGGAVALTATDLVNSVATGFQAGYGWRDSTENTVSGYASMGYSGGLGTASYNSAFGSWALYRTSGDYSAALGTRAGYNRNGDHNTYIGALAGEIGVLTAESNTLRIQCHATNELVLGDGANKLFAVDGALQVADTTATAASGMIKYSASTLQAYTSAGYYQTLDKPIRDETGNYIAVITDETINITANSNTITLPTAVGIRGKEFLIKNSGVGSPIVDGDLAETIDGAASVTLTTQYEWVRVKSDGANWIIIGQG